jgi:hypothetical protein
MQDWAKGICCAFFGFFYSFLVVFPFFLVFVLAITLATRREPTTTHYRRINNDKGRVPLTSINLDISYAYGTAHLTEITDALSESLMSFARK